MQPADTPFVEKEEAREVGLCRGVHLGLQKSLKLCINCCREKRQAGYRDLSAMEQPKQSSSLITD
jgi:hypothetical protein